MKKLRTLVSAILTVPMLLSFTGGAAYALERPGARAEETSSLTPVASYDFSQGSLSDSVNGYAMTLHGGASIGAFGDRNGNEALNLQNGQSDAAKNVQYAELPSQIFESIGNAATIDFAAKSRHADDGNYFSLAVGKDASHYLFFYLSKTSAKLAVADNGWHNEPSFKEELDNNDGIWHDFRIIIKDDSMALLRDSKLVGIKTKTGIKLSDLGGFTTYIGRSFYQGDAYWNGAIDDLKIYKGADMVMPTGLNVAGTGLVDGSLALAENEERQLIATITPENAISKEVGWASSNPAAATVDANGKIKAVKAGNTTVTATSQAGGLVSSVAVTVKPLDPETAAQDDVDALISAVPSQVTGNLPLLAKGPKHDIDVTWTSSDPGRISPTNNGYQAPANGAADPYRGAGIVTRPAYGQGDSKKVSLTATAKADNGRTVSRSVDVVVKEKPRSAPNVGYAAVTFLSDANTTGGKIGEALYESATSTERNDFFSFSPINNGDPVITSKTDTTGLRDPYVLRSHDGDEYYMIATDLKVSRQGWGQNQQYGSLKIEAWKSKDMVNWTRTNADDGSDAGIVVNSPNQGMTWAPEAFWDDALNAYVVFFSSRAYTDGSRSTAINGKKGSPYNIVRYAITRDFKTFTPAKDWQDTGYSRIDSTVFKIGSYYYRMTKNEESGAAGSYVVDGKSTFLERSKCLTCTTSSSDPDADETSTWRLLDQRLLPFEGPESIALNKDDVNQNETGDAMVIMADSGGYQPFMTSKTDLSRTDWSHRLSQTPGWFTQKKPGKGVTGYVTDDGMPTPKRHGAFVAVPRNVLEAMHQYTTASPSHLEPVASTTQAGYDSESRKLTVTVKAEDQGDVAGGISITQSPASRMSQSWTADVKLGADGKAAVTVPDEVSGDIRIDYQGYADKLVKPSSTEVTGLVAKTAETGGSGIPDAHPSQTPSVEQVKGGSAGSASRDPGLSETGASVGIIALAALACAVLAICWLRLAGNRSKSRH
ncbi:Ig-like domain-containing protein [Bifidobacterium apicola]|uniref:Ig-like domain-containing protein n=1 Tax=Bifidobacterium apicola TaxID=3230739 RepID=UPI0036F211AD